jgi:hypothetical protein
LKGGIEKIKEFNIFLGYLPHKYKIIIAGNHDKILEKITLDEKKELFSNAIYLEDSSVTINDIKFYGSPWQPYHTKNKYTWAFQKNRGEELLSVWKNIPEDTDVLSKFKF